LTIRPYTELREARIADSTPALALTLHNSITHETREVEYDVVVCGTGYNRQDWRTILFPPASSAAAVEAEQAEEVVPLSDLFAVRRAGSASPPNLSLADSVFAQIRPTARRSGSSSVGSSSASPSTAANSPTRYDSPSRHSSISYESASTAPTSPPSPRSVVEPKLSAAAAASKAQIITGLDCTVKENYRLDLPTKTASGADFKPTV
ncbi:hypothetical protein H3U06_18455, partial [Clostridioides difficile]|nr:hypothetical protein [Clostridioides difficile]